MNTTEVNVTRVAAGVASIAAAAAVPPDLEERIEASLVNGVIPDDIVALIREVEAVAHSLGVAAEEANIIACSTVRSTAEKREARRLVEDAASQRERLQSEIADLRERLDEVRKQEEDKRRWPAYEQAKATRDKLAAELRDIYPGIEQKLRELLPRIAENDREIEYINAHALPNGGKRLLEAELVARGLPGFFEDGVHTPRIVTDLRVPAWERDPHEPYAWPRSR
jgi:hypothetical protein